MEWLNEPASWDHSADRLTVEADGETDFWRVTKHGFVADDGHFFHRDVAGDFTATVEVAGEYGTLYDQAGLMVREDAETWLKCGVEYVDGVQQVGAVVTRGVSDWSKSPLNDDPESVWVRVERTGSTVEVSFSRDGDDYVMIRQASLSEAERLRVGPMAAAPKGDGFRTTFEGFSVETE
ncbi:hypothetical protein C475_08266 [Halosimplex carlsbadense 2-9-1]|uniref:DUF1349 domain-containing protein n=1 Tax=Halosimplex carlsbadense 2-9-1 TaxID=797114 RepID=M0CYF0_9EURY|nr:DUF1349 domain-containing protein [Halosimplex carlsbadense]ELZ26914.1 hypothetical protein C475_08266 [Halosimplex carlsbadense 2-9-1]